MTLVGIPVAVVTALAKRTGAARVAIDMPDRNRPAMALAESLGLHVVRRLLVLSRAMVIGVALVGIAAIVGPLLGGWLTDSLGWRSIFWFFLTFGVIAWVAVAIALRMPARHTAVRVDRAGLGLSSAGAAGIVPIVTWGGTTLA